MSGIAGIIRFDGAPVPQALVEGLTASMAHRGPDGRAHWCHGSVGLGHCMLRTTPESLEEAQPLADESGALVLVLDGRVDNWIELRGELLGRGARLRSRSDAELVLRAYEAWGDACVRYIDGDFAFVIWDARQHRVFCARDRTGAKPLHYCLADNVLAFASELHPLLELPWVSREPNEGMLAEFLAGAWLSTDETLWSAVKRLPAASTMEVRSGSSIATRYWTPDVHATLGYRRDEEYFEHYRALLTDRVRRLSRSHLPIAMEVSGGLDSSAVFGIAERLRHGGELLSPGIHAITLTTAGDADADEVDYARALSRGLDAPIEETPASVLSPDWYARHAAFYQDFPGFPNASMFEGLRRLSVERGCRVTLGGEGGDTWLEGTRYYYSEELRGRDWPVLLDCLRADVSECGWLNALRWLAGYGVVPMLPAVMRRPFALLASKPGVGERPAEPFWMSPRLLAVYRDRLRDASLRAEPVVRQPGQLELLRRLDDAFNAQVLERCERDAARAGTEVRLPFQGAPLIEFLFAIPERLRLRGATSKYIHTRALRGVVPALVLDRVTKANFGGTFSRQLIGLRGEIAGSIARRRAGWVDAGGIDRLCASLEPVPRFGWPLWVLWSFYGCDLVMGGADGSAPAPGQVLS